MISDDKFRKRRQAIVASIETWASEMAPWASIEFGPIGDAWRVIAVPNATAACPFEMVIRADQCVDMVIDGETYEDIALDGDTKLPSIVRAIADGRVVIRRWASSTTGLLYDVETIIKLPEGSEWCISRRNPDAPAGDVNELISTPTAFAPYRR